MKLTEIDVTANMAWSPGAQARVMMAAGTAAQQFDATFNTSSSLELYELSLADSGMNKVASLPVDHRFHKVVWGEVGMQKEDTPNGLLVGGLDGGVINVYDPARIMAGHEQPLLFSKDKHQGPVVALDFNPFQANLLASGASESEIFIWDLNRLQSPMTPGAKIQPVDDVRFVAWNRQVQHILASAFASRCVVWDLRKNEPIIKVSDSTSRMRCKVVAWNPDVATQLCLASEDDHSPIIQVWDLRLASSPLRTLEQHERGILSLSWCKQDSDLLLSCGKDNRILCWNPNSNVPGGEVVSELTTSNQWTFDVAFCPRYPAVLSCSSFDGKIAVYSLLDGQPSTQPTKSIADSFPGMEAMQPAISSNHTVTSKRSAQPKFPPKWMRPRSGARFAFGGKLITFGQEAADNKQGGGESAANVTRQVYVSSVVTETDLVHRSTQLETSLANHNMSEFCQLKLSNACDMTENDRQVWSFIQANFTHEPCKQYLSLLGYDSDNINKEITSACVSETQSAQVHRHHEVEEQLSDDFTLLSTVNGHDETFEAIAAQAEVEELSRKPFAITTDNSGSGLLSRALISGNLPLAVELCLQQQRMADALILALQGGEELYSETRRKYFAKSGDLPESHLIKAAANNDWKSVVERCELSNWREALSAALTHANHDELPALCDLLGERLLQQGSAMAQQAMICFICANNLDKVVECWIATHEDGDNNPMGLQDLVEVVMTLKYTADHVQMRSTQIGTGLLSSRLSRYSSLLAAQGALTAAATYLDANTNDEEMLELRDRLAGALKPSTSAPVKPHRADAPQNRSHFARGGRGEAEKAMPSSAASAMTPSAVNASSRPAWVAPSGLATTPAAPSHAGPVMGYTPQPQVSSYSHGIHNPSVDTFNPNAAYYDHTGVSQPRGSRHATPSSAYDNFNAGRMVASQQPPVNIFTPDYSQSMAPAPPGRTISGDMSSGGYSQQDQSLASAMPPTSAGPGWNDPPMSMVTSKSKLLPKTVASSSPSDPITQPILAPPSVPVPDPNQWQQYDNYRQPHGMMPHQPYAPHPTGNYMMPSAAQVSQPMPVAAAPAAATGAMPAARRIMESPEPAKPKPPISQEHRVLQEVFNTLREKCMATSNHPQIRRKLDDVEKKLDVLYDKLRDESLPPHTVASLHSVVECVWGCDYNRALATIHHIVSGGSFAILSEFMPGVKVLIQVAMQLNVFLERPR